MPIAPNGQGQGIGLQAVAYASRFLGVRYLWGGTTPNGFDCSGLVQFVYKHFGVNLPRTSEEQALVGQPVPRNKLQPGDILFYDTSGKNSHEAMYVGNGMQIVARHTGTNVQYQHVGNFTHAMRVSGGAGAPVAGSPGIPGSSPMMPIGSNTAAPAKYDAATCAMGVGSICFLSKSQARALIGGLILLGAGLIILSGTIALLAYGLTNVKAPKGVPEASKVASDANL